MAHSLKMEVVETKPQLDFLRRLDCDVIQGFLISRPLPPAEITSCCSAGARSGTSPISTSGNFFLLARKRVSILRRRDDSAERRRLTSSEEDGSWAKMK